MTRKTFIAMSTRAASAMGVMLLLAACSTGNKTNGTTLKFSGSALGAEGTLVARQLDQFMRLHPDIHVELQRTPDDATQRHQLYVQWLNARAGNPDILQLDVVWTPEFAAAGWILPLTRFAPPAGDFFPATVEANSWAGHLYALPWFADVGLLYRRTDLVPTEPQSLDELSTDARNAMAKPGGAGPRYGIVWQGARYEGLVTSFVEYLGAFGGRILDAGGQVVVNRPEAVRALTFMRGELYDSHIAPLDILTWHEEEARYAFQNGNAVFMRNWPYAYAPMSDKTQSRVAGKYAVSPMPGAAGGRSTAALGGAQLAINAYSEAPAAAYQLIAYLTAPEQMLQRAQAVGQYPTRRAVYDDPRLKAALAIPPENAKRAIESATPRPVTPIYTELSEILQIELHRALVRQAEPQEALDLAAKRIEALIERTGLRKLMASRAATIAHPAVAPGANAAAGAAMPAPSAPDSNAVRR